MFCLLLFSNNENPELFTVIENLKVSFPEKFVEPGTKEESQMAGLRDKRNDGIEMCSSTVQSKE